MNSIVEPRSHEVTKVLEPELRFAEFEEAWQIKSLSSLLDVIDGDRGANYPNSSEFSSKGHCLFLNAKNVTKTGFIFSERNFITKDKDNALRKGKLEREDIVLTTRGSVGFFAFYSSNINYDHLRINSGMVLLRNKSSDLLPLYFYKFTASKALANEIKKIAFGSAQPQLTVKEIKRFKIQVPSFQEQQKIADFLSSVDKKIEQLTEKHRLLTEYKKGVMQQLFTQQIRFKDNQGNDYAEWEEKKLGDVFYGTKGQGLSKNVLVENGSSKCILYGELYTTYPEVITEVISKTNELVSVQSIQGDLLIPCSTTTTGIDLANVTVINESGVLLGGDITVLRFVKTGNATFFAYYLTHHKKHKLASYGQGSTIVHVYYSHFKNMIINYPSSTEEQQKIANFLTEIDQKIDQAWSALEQTKAFKKGLLQKMFV